MALGDGSAPRGPVFSLKGWGRQDPESCKAISSRIQGRRRKTRWPSAMGPLLVALGGRSVPRSPTSSPEDRVRVLRGDLQPNSGTPPQDPVAVGDGCAPGGPS